MTTSGEWSRVAASWVEERWMRGDWKRDGRRLVEGPHGPEGWWHAWAGGALLPDRYTSREEAMAAADAYSHSAGTTGSAVHRH